MNIQRIIGGPDLSKDSNCLKMYISRNTGLLPNTDKIFVTLWCAFLGKGWVYRQSQVYFYTASIRMA